MVDRFSSMEESAEDGFEAAEASDESDIDRALDAMERIETAFDQAEGLLPRLDDEGVWT